MTDTKLILIDLFKKLAAGIKFDTKRFRQDAERFQVN